MENQEKVPSPSPSSEPSIRDINAPGPEQLVPVPSEIEKPSGKCEWHEGDVKDSDRGEGSSSSDDDGGSTITPGSSPSLTATPDSVQKPEDTLGDSEIGQDSWSKTRPDAYIHESDVYCPLDLTEEAIGYGISSAMRDLGVWEPLPEIKDDDGVGNDKDCFESRELHKEHLTVGVELEVLLAGLEDRAARFSLAAEVFRELAVLLKTEVLSSGPTSGKPQDVGDKRPSEAFQIKDGRSQREGAPPESGEPVEIATPALGDGDWEWVIPEITRLLEEKFTVNFDPSTSLHVHVGIKRPYTLQDLKRICKAIILFEDRMDEHHPIDRRGPGHNGDLCSCRHNPILTHVSNSQAIAMIGAAQSRETLLELMHPGTATTDGIPVGQMAEDIPPADEHIGASNRGYKYNIASVCKYETIEFRQAQGTADAKWIDDWITRVLRFVTEAIRTSDRSFNGWAKHETLADEVYRCFGILSPDPDPEATEGAPSFDLGGTESIGELSIGTESVEGSTISDPAPSS